MDWEVHLRNGIYLPQIGWHLDARKPTPQAFVSHAHFDHCGKHDSIVCSKGTARLLQARLGGQRTYRTYEFGEPFELVPGTKACLYPAGHIPGSAMLRLEREGRSLLYTGDFKLSPSLIAEACQVPKADTLVIETTYGLPKYAFPPSSEVALDIKAFCEGVFSDGKTPVLFGYSLGKAQEIIAALAHCSFEIMVNPEVLRMTQVCQELGFEFPPYRSIDYALQEKAAIVGPPPNRNSNWLDGIRSPVTAMVSGWAVDSSYRHRSRADRAFPLSDHADFLDLQECVRLADPQIVYTTHGFAQEFAETLGEQGIDAWALGVENQMGLGLASPPTQKPRPSVRQEAPPPTDVRNAFLDFSRMVDSVAKIEGQAEKAQRIATYFETVDPEFLSDAVLFAASQPFPKSSKRKLPIDRTLIRQALSSAADSTGADFKLQSSRGVGRELALVESLSGASAGTRTLKDIRSLFRHLEKAPNPVFQHSILTAELRKLGPTEARCLSRLMGANLKAGIDESTVEMALALRFSHPVESVRRANQRCSDLQCVANAAIDGMLDFVPLQVFYPLPLVGSTRAAFDLETLSTLPAPIWVEYLFDGLRCQIHKIDERVEIFDGSGAPLTHKFPEIAEAAASISYNFVTDGTLLAWQKETPLPFAALEERLRRAPSELLLGREVDTTVWIHDLLWLNGESMLDQPLHSRKRELDTFSVNTKLRISPVTTLDSTQALGGALKEAQDRGHLGVIVKDKGAPYDTLSESTWFRFK
ncbi:MAG: hypothetical protein CBD18_06930 [Opitutales bacterium TMED158]|nr:MAG: hypothetical protein CBD18_06930 [Opitutales bacterium TMED158]